MPVQAAGLCPRRGGYEIDFELVVLLDAGQQVGVVFQQNAFGQVESRGLLDVAQRHGLRGRDRAAGERGVENDDRVFSGAQVRVVDAEVDGRIGHTGLVGEKLTDRLRDARKELEAIVDR